MQKDCPILIVDNAPRMCDSLETILNEYGYQTRTCNNGYEAVDILEKSRFDIVLLDICMEGMDGFEVMEKTVAHQNDTQFIMMTGYDSKEKAVRAFQAGASLFLRKPFDPDELLGIIKNLLSKKKQVDLLRLNIERHSNLAESETKFRSLFDFSPLPMVVTEMDTGRIIDVNSAFCNFSEYTREELVDNFVSKIGISPVLDREKNMTTFRTSGKIKGMETEMRIKDGTRRNVLVFSRSYECDIEKYLLIQIIDQTGRKRLESQGLSIQKIEAMATLSGGIAHQFNNALQVLIGSIELLLMELPNNTKTQTFGRRASESTQRMVTLIKQLIAYSREGNYECEFINLNDTIRNTLPLLATVSKPDIVVEAKLSEDDTTIYADSSQLQMVLSAVFENAVEALESEGRIVVTTENREIDTTFSANHPGLGTGSYVCLKIEDDGKGMDEKTKSRIFEPFFTTKFQGRGLGMSAVYGIVKNHGGYLYVDSEIGAGTSVYVLIPSGRSESI